MKHRSTYVVALALGALAAGCALEPPYLVPSSSKPGYVGPVPVEAVARLLVENRGDRGDQVDVSAPPFLVAVSPLWAPQDRPSTPICEWGDDDALKSFDIVDSRSQRPYDNSHSAEWGRVEQVFRIDEAWVAHPASPVEIRLNRLPTYNIAFFCAHGDSVLLVISHYCGPVCGFGADIVLERREGMWRFVAIRGGWIS